MDDEYNAYRYMVTAAMARPLSLTRRSRPSSIATETCGSRSFRRRSLHPLVYRYLQGDGGRLVRLAGKFSVNTSLSTSAGRSPGRRSRRLDAMLKRGQGAFTGLVMIGANGEAFVTLAQRADGDPRMGGLSSCGGWGSARAVRAAPRP